jgi:hypothetical protein
MESKLGALWRKEKTERGPIAKGSLDFSRMEDADIKRIYEALTAKGKIFITMWQNRHDEGDKKPDLTITLDKPYTPGEVQHKPESSEIPF